MKRLFTLALSALMLTMLFGCGAPAAKPAEAPASTGTPAPKEASAPAGTQANDPAELTEKTFTAAELEGKVKLLGRAWHDQNGIRCDWPACGFEFTAFCGGTLSFSTKTNGSNFRFRVFVDGVEADRVLKLNGEETKPIWKDLPEGQHTIRVVRENDCAKGTRTFFSAVTLSCRPDSLEATPDKDLFIEFLGDSITSGSGAFGDMSQKWADRCSATRSYASVASEILDADCALISRGSIGATKTYGGMTSAELYRTVEPFNPDTVPYVYTREPDVVVIELSGNDPENDPDTPFHDAMVAYGKLVRELHPNAKLVYYWYTPKHTTVFPTLAEELGGEEAGVYLVRTERYTDGIPNEPGKDGHPSLRSHEILGKAVAEFLKTNVLK